MQEPAEQKQPQEIKIEEPVPISLDNDIQDIPIDRTESESKEHQEVQKKQSREEKKEEAGHPALETTKEEVHLTSEEKVEISTKEDAGANFILQLNDIANMEMYYEEDHTIGDIKIRITGSVQKGSTLSKYTAYLIVGEDAKGKFELVRRYSQFDALRSLVKERWPGCFIPSLPEKNIIKNSPQTVAERQRILDDFLKKLAHNKHIYYGDQVQLFLRSGEMDITTNFEKQPKLSIEQIINKYRNIYSQLGGKQVSSEASIRISTFKTCLKRVQQQLPQLSEAILNLAQSRDYLNARLPGFTHIMQQYQRNTIAQFSEGNTRNLVYTNVENLQIQAQQENLKKISKANPFWFVSDMIKIEQKDCVSFIETIELIDRYNEKRLTCESDIRSLEKEIEELALGNSTLSSMTTRKSKEEVKKGLEEKNKKTIEEKHHLMQLGDMLIALISYVQIDNYKLLKKKYYSTLLKKLTGHEAFAVLNLQHMWSDVFKVVDAIRPSK